MIVVTGANGALGRGVVEALLRRLPAGALAASVRNLSAAASLAERGVSVRSADFAEPDGLAAAFRGADQVLIVSVDRFGEEARRMHRAAIAAARAAGARRVLYTSHMGARPGSAFADHVDAEAALAGAGLAFTALRHGFYAESALHLIGRGLDEGEIRAPEDGPVSWTARADLAEADAALLADAGRLDGATPPLVAPEAFTLADIAAAASELTGREVRRTVVPDEAWREAAVAGGLPPPMAEVLLGMYRSARRGELASDDATLGLLIGRRPSTMRDALAARLAAPARV